MTNNETTLSYRELQRLIDIAERELAGAAQLTGAINNKGNYVSAYDGNRGEWQTIIHKLQDMQAEDNND